MGSPEEGELFFRERWPEARAVSDAAKQLYAAFGLAPASLSKVVGPKVMWSGLVSTLRGHLPGKPVGDVTMMSGWFLVRGAQVLWSQKHEHSGAARRWDELRAAWSSATSSTP